MQKTPIGAGVPLLASLLSLAGVAVAQEPVRLRPVSAIYLDAEGASIYRPESVAYDGKTLLVAADTGNGRLLTYRVDAEEVVPSSKIVLPEAHYPIVVRIDSNGDILVLDGRSHRIARVGADGKFKSYVEIASNEGQRPIAIRSFATDSSDRLFVLDVSGSRILVVGGDGAVQREIAFPDEVGFLSDLTVSSAGVVFAVDSVGRRVFVAQREDSVLAPLTEPLTDELVFPTAIAVDASGHLFLADQSGGAIVALGQDGSYLGQPSKTGWTAGFLRYPSGLSCANGYLYVADRGNNRIQGFAILP